MKSFVEMVTIGSLGFALMLSLKCVLNSRNQRSSLWLGFFVLLLAGSVSEFLIEESPILRSMIGGTYWLYGPVLLFYVKTRINTMKEMTRTQWLHLLPCPLYFLMLIAGDHIRSQELINTLDFVLYEVVFMHIIGYFVCALYHARVYKKSMFFESWHERMTSVFITMLPAVVLTIFGSSWLIINATLFSPWQMPTSLLNIIQIGLCLTILFIALFNTEMHPQPKAKEVY